MKVVFRLGAVAFSLAVDRLVEIVDVPGHELERSAPPREPLSGRFRFRGESLAVIDLHPFFGAASTRGSQDLLVLVVTAGGTTWGLAVDDVLGVFPAREFQRVTLSPLFHLGADTGYRCVDLWRGTPLVDWEPERFVPAGAAP